MEDMIAFDGQTVRKLCWGGSNAGYVMIRRFPIPQISICNESFQLSVKSIEYADIEKRFIILYPLFELIRDVEVCLP
jgi:hypothetical protein